MNEYTIYRNIKRWLVTYGIELLDLILPIENPDETVPIHRYDDLLHEFDEHFNLLAYYSIQVEPHFPVILVSFKELTGNSCFPKWRVIFDVYFQTVSPQDCKDDEYFIGNTPEELLEYQLKVDEALCNLIQSAGDDLRVTEFHDEPWGYPINYNVDNDTSEPVEGVLGQEILHFQHSFDLSDNISVC